MKSEGPSGKFIVVKRKTLLYKIFVKDLKGIKMRARKILPRVPSFEGEQDSKDRDTEAGSTSGEGSTED